MAEETPQESLEEPREEFFENNATDLEVEDVGQLAAGEKPWDPSRIRISTKPFSLRQVVDMIGDGDIDLAPDFQKTQRIPSHPNQPPEKATRQTTTRASS